MNIKTRTETVYTEVERALSRDVVPFSRRAIKDSRRVKCHRMGGGIAL